MSQKKIHLPYMERNMVGTDFLVPASIGKIIFPGGSGEQGNIGVYIPLFATNHQ